MQIQGQYMNNTSMPINVNNVCCKWNCGYTYIMRCMIVYKVCPIATGSEVGVVRSGVLYAGGPPSCGRVCVQSGEGTELMRKFSRLPKDW